MGETNSLITMTKKKDEPITDAKPWLKLFDQLCGYKHEPSRLLEDYLDLTLCAVANGRREARYLEVAKRYTREELELVSQLFGMHVMIHEHQTAPGADGKRGWYDLLGDTYMELSGRSKTSRLGQFFTPVELCRVIAQMTLLGETAGRTVCDPCCGSGRLLLAAKALAPDLGTCFAADVDAICVKMCALNFWLHGVRGEVAHMNSLSLQWYGAYHTHPNIHWPFVTYLDESRREESHLWVQREQLVTVATPVVPPAAPDLFSGVEEPEEPYGDPWRPCDLCGASDSDTCRLVDGRVVAPWEFHGDQLQLLCCPGCGAPMRNSITLNNTETA